MNNKSIDPIELAVRSFQHPIKIIMLRMHTAICLVASFISYPLRHIIESMNSTYSFKEFLNQSKS